MEKESLEIGETGKVTIKLKYDLNDVQYNGSGRYVDGDPANVLTFRAFSREQYPYWEKLEFWVTTEGHLFSEKVVKYVTILAPSAVGDEDDAAKTPAIFTLSQNRPNPFNPATAIPFTLREDDHVRLTVYDLLGREVAVLVDGYMSAGTHELTWDGYTREGMSCGSGIYHYRLVTPHGSDSRRMTLVR